MEANLVIDSEHYQIIYEFVPGEKATFDYPGASLEINISEVFKEGELFEDYDSTELEWMIFEKYH